ncbi:unnamed protein product [Phaedon cochleariae]|uniref:Uncharacterized protein n=1 Tax=Phaedon cochleariae TaxID=80249 RepID=A0A9N9X6U0_PHACE|nr:unnamed protein product [Phaedon cochleariae]
MDFAPPDTPSISTISPPSSPFPQTPTPTVPPTSSGSKPPTSSAPPMLSPLVYQTPQGMMYAATPSAGGMILSLAQPDGSSSRPQFITIPLSMVAANGMFTGLDDGYNMTTETVYADVGDEPYTSAECVEISVAASGVSYTV